MVYRDDRDALLVTAYAQVNTGISGTGALPTTDGIPTV